MKLGFGLLFALCPLLLAEKVFICDESRANHTETVRAALWRRGWRENKKSWSPEFDLKWTWTFGRSKLVQSNQFINHFSNSEELTDKHRLDVNLKRLYGANAARISPLTIDLTEAGSRGRLLELSAQARTMGVANESDFIWIAKPRAAARGMGIKVFSDAEALLSYVDEETAATPSHFLAQQYIHPPLLIEEHKFDLRVFVLVTSLRPLEVYLYPQPYVRFCSLPYSIDKLDDIFRHLTNHQVQKDSNVEFTPFNQWSIQQLQHWLGAKFGANAWSELLERLKRLTAATFAAMPDKGHRANSFELFGLDVLVDPNLKPWLIEVNMSPGLHMITDVVRSIYPNMIDDLFRVALGEGPPADPDRAWIKLDAYRDAPLD